MSNVYLGPSGSETLLADIEWLSDQGDPDLVATGAIASKPILRKTMADGSQKFAILNAGPKHRWPRFWGILTGAQVTVLYNLYLLNSVLRFKDEGIEDQWYDVILTYFEKAPISTGLRSYDKFKVSMEIEER